MYLGLFYVYLEIGEYLMVVDMFMFIVQKFLLNSDVLLDVGSMFLDVVK